MTKILKKSKGNTQKKIIKKKKKKKKKRYKNIHRDKALTYYLYHRQHQTSIDPSMKFLKGPLDELKRILGHRLL